MPATGQCWPERPVPRRRESTRRSKRPRHPICRRRRWAAGCRRSLPSRSSTMPAAHGFPCPTDRRSAARRRTCSTHRCLGRPAARRAESTAHPRWRREPNAECSLLFDSQNVDDRGSFTEIIRTSDRGQFSVNISKPGITKGQHWHHSKNEKFVVVSGHGLIQLRKIGTEEVVSFEVSGGRMEVVEMIPGYTHNIVNLSETEDLVTFMWCNECFDPARPDTYFEKV